MQRRLIKKKPLAARRKPKSKLLNLYVLLITLITILALGEIATRIAYSGKIVAADEYELAQKLLYKQLINLSDQNRFYYGRTLRWTHDSQLGLVPNPGFKRFKTITLDYNSTHYARIRIVRDYINSIGLRTEQEFNLTKPDNVTRIAFLGDSFTLGDDTDVRFSFPNILQELLPDTEVMNFAMSGKGTEYMYIIYKLKAKKYNPDVVVMNIFIEDLGRNGHGNELFFQPQLYLDEQGNLKIRNKTIPTYQEFLESYRHTAAESYFLKFLQSKISSLFSKDNYVYGLEMLSPILDALYNETGGNLLVTVFFASPQKTVGPRFEHLSQVYSALKRMLDEKGIPYMNGIELFLEEMEKYDGTISDKFFYENRSGHFSETGNGVFALGIKEKLEELEFIENNTENYFTFYYLDTKHALAAVDRNLEPMKIIKAYDILEIAEKSADINYTIIDEGYVGDDIFYREETIII